MHNVAQDIKNRVKRLRAQIDDLRYRYHVLNDPQVTDEMYDGLMDELRQIEKKFPKLVTPDSPTQRVAGKPLDKFAKVTHQVTQWSFDDAFSKEEMADWIERNMKILEKHLGHRPSDLNYCCELKLDGLHMVLTYVKGRLEIAATRGDGKVGENVTQNIRTILSAPINLKKEINLIAGGEVWLDRKMLDKINAERKKTGEPLFANPRNAAAGTIRQLDAKIVSARRLALTAYDISSDNAPSLQEEELRELRTLGFKTDEHWKVVKDLEGIMGMHDYWQKRKDSQPFWIDGIVIKINQKKYQNLLGYTGKSPRWAIAFKFPAEQGTTKILDIYVQVGRTGALTPVALMEPVHLAGTTVTHATLHNFDEIRRLGVKIGDTVVVEKAGDIIPKVVRVLDKMRTGREQVVHEPRVCPICHSPVVKVASSDKKKANEGLIFCTNKKCFAQQLGRMEHFVSKSAFDIDHLGEKIVAQLVNYGLVKDAADLFALTVDDLLPIERFGEKSAANLINAIQEKKIVSLHRFINALGIKHVGEQTAVDLAEHFGSLNKFLRADKEELLQIAGVGEEVGEAIVIFLKSAEEKKYIDKLLNNGVQVIDEKKKKGGRLAGKMFVLTGTLSNMERSVAKEKIRALGGEVGETVSKNTFAVIAGNSPGSKYDKAKKIGVQVMNENEFLAMLQS